MAGESLEDALGWNLGRYTLHGEIASGGMATVHIGRMIGTAGFSKMVAIKRLHAQFAKDPEFVAMFLDEARLAARVHHPNVVQPLDVIATDGEAFLVMEYIRGESLSKIQRFLRPTGGQVPLKIAGAIMVGVLHGLHAAHEATNERGEPLGIVHRDVSPQNVLIGTDGTARVLDFGIAKAADRAYSTKEGDLKGKLAYMAPEQLTAESPVDRRTDIYAASIVLWELITGKRLFDSDYQSAILARARDSEVDPPSKYVPDLPAGIDDVLRKGLARRPKERFATAREMAIQLEICMPLATPSKVGEWVETVAAEALAKRAARIAEIEAELPAASARDQARVLLSELQASSGMGPPAGAPASRRDPTAPTKKWSTPKSERTMDRGDTPLELSQSALILEPQSLTSTSATAPTTPNASNDPRAAPTRAGGTIRPSGAPPPPSMRPPPPSMRPPPAPASRPAVTSDFPRPDLRPRGDTPPSIRPPPPTMRASQPPPPQPQPVSVRLPGHGTPVNPTPPTMPLSPVAVPTGAFPLGPSPGPRPPVVVTDGVPELPPVSSVPLVAPAVDGFALPEIGAPVPFEMPRGGGTINVTPGVSTKPKRGSVLPALIVLVLAVGAFFFALPSIMKGAYIREAQRRGIHLEVSDVDVSLKGVRLFGVRATFAEAPGVHVAAREIDFPSPDKGQPAHMIVRDADVLVDGTWSQIADGLARWTGAHPLREASREKGSIAIVEVTHAHLVWGRVLGDNTKLDVDEISGDAARIEDHALGDDWRIMADRIQVFTPLGAIGPWHGTVVHAPVATSANLALSPASTDPATLSFVDQVNGGTALDLKIPRSTIEKIGIPRAVAGIPIEEPLPQVEASVHYASPTPSKLELEAAFALYGVKLAGASAPVDARFQGRFRGDPSAAIDMTDGLVSIAGFKGRAWGKGVFLHDGFRVDGQWRTAPRSCSSVAKGDVDPATLNLAQIAYDEPSFAALDKQVAAAPTAKEASMSGGFVLESRDLAQARLSAATTNRCNAKIFQ